MIAPAMLIDVHQHIWTEPLLEALAGRDALPFVRRKHGVTVLYSAGEQPYVIDVEAEAPERRAELVRSDGLDLALVAISSPIGIETLPRDDANSLIAAHLDGVFALPDEFAVWGPVALERSDPADIDELLGRGCVGISLPATALAGRDALHAHGPLLEQIAARGAPLLVHPGGAAAAGHGLVEPLWWRALTDYVSQMQAAWLTFAAFGRREHPELMVIFTMLAGGAPLLSERLDPRGGPEVELDDPLVFYDTSSYGPVAIEAMARRVGGAQLVYGSDRPVIEPTVTGRKHLLQANGVRALKAGGTRLRRRAGAQNSGAGLTAAELERFVAELAAAPERWRHLVRHTSDARVYEQIWADAEVNAWVICWSEDQDTGFHDHDESRAAIAVISGCVYEDRLTIGSIPSTRELSAGQILTVPQKAIHRVLHAGSEPAVTIHAYSPPLTWTGAYRVGPDGTLERELVPPERELRAVAALG